MAINNSQPMRFTPRGLVDAYDATDVFPGACQALQNLVFDQSNPELVVSRPGTVTIADFIKAGFVTPSTISIQGAIGTRIYGLIATGRNAGHDEPFVYETATNSFIALSGVTSGNTPLTQAAGGDWTPPTIASIGVMVIVTHPGFPGGGTKFGWFDVTTPASPVWHGGDTATNGLTGTPQAVANFNNRAWFAVGNQAEYCDVLVNPPTRTAATQALTIGDAQPINALAGLPLSTTSSGILATLTVFKQSQIWQIAGDTTTSNLSEQYVSLTIGTIGPRTIAQSTLGLYFMSSAGPYVIDQLGTVRALTSGMNTLNPDIQAPMQNAVNPTRWAGAYTSGIYRLCGQTIIHGQQITGDYWFDEHKRRWTGPHTFAYDCASAINGVFILSSAQFPAQLMSSNPNQNVASVFTDLGSPISVLLQSSTFPKTGDMCMKQVAESQIELSASGGTVVYTITAQDEQGNALDSVTLSVNKFGTTWGGTLWGASLWAFAPAWGGGGIWGTIAEGGSGGIWQSSIQIPKTFPVSWDAPLVFEKMQLQIQAVASASVGIGTFYARYQKTGYMTFGALMNLRKLRSYLALNAIIGGLPSNILNGQPIDAVPLMADLNWIVNQVNTNVPPLINTLQSGFIFVGAASVGGTANAITLTPTPVNAGYAAGQSYRFAAKFANTGAVTINTSGLGTRALISTNGGALTGGELQAGGIYDICDNGTAYELLSTAAGTQLGNFTPILTFNGGSVGMTYSSQLGRYIKIQNLVFFTLYIALTAKGSSTGAVVLQGFPFVANASVGANSGGASGFLDTVTFPGNYSMGMITGSATAAILSVTSGNPVANFTNANFANTSSFAFSGWYTV